MIHVITSNGIPFSKITEYVDNFTLVHMRTKELYIGLQPMTTYIFDIYHQDGMTSDDISPDGMDYESCNGYEYNFIPVEGVTIALDMIAQTVIENDNAIDDEDSQITLAIATPSTYANQIKKYLNNIFSDRESGIEALNMLQYMKSTSLDKLARTVKSILNTEFVYPDDPVSFSYSVYLALIGGIS